MEESDESAVGKLVSRIRFRPHDSHINSSYIEMNMGGRDEGIG